METNIHHADTEDDQAAQSYGVRIALEAMEQMILQTMDEEALRVFQREIRGLEWLADQKQEDLQRQRIKRELNRSLYESEE